MAAARAGFALITPASRGIGFALAQQLLVHTDLPVCATARKDCEKVHEKLMESVKSQRVAADRLTVLKTDVTGKIQYQPVRRDGPSFHTSSQCSNGGWVYKMFLNSYLYR